MAIRGRRTAYFGLGALNRYFCIDASHTILANDERAAKRGSIWPWSLGATRFVKPIRYDKSVQPYVLALLQKIFEPHSVGGLDRSIPTRACDVRNFCNRAVKTAYATIKGFEVMRMFKKGQFTPWIDALGGGTEASFVNRLFGIYA